MLNSSSDSDSCNSSCSSSEDLVDINRDEMGQLSYQLEPEYTQEELNQLDREQSERQRLIDNNPRKNDTTWCSCEKCLSMPLLEECMCCHEFTLFNEHLEIGQCLLISLNFKLCLNTAVLETSYVSFLRYKRFNGRAPDVLTNR